MGYDHRCVIKEVKKKMFLTWKRNRRAEQQLFGEVGFRLWTKRDREWVFQLAEQRVIICRQTAQRLFSHMGIDRTWQSFAVKICQRDTFLSCTLTFLVRNLSRNLPRVYWKIGKNIRDAVGLGCGKEKRLETLWGKKNTNEVTKGRGIHNHRKSNRWSWFWCTEFIEKFIWGVRIYSFYEINCFSRILWK